MSKYRNITQVADIFKALGNPNRLAIFLNLAACCPPRAADRGCCVGELGLNMDLAPSTLSHHLKELSRAGLVRTTRRGRFVQCSVNPEVARAVDTFLQTMQVIPDNDSTGDRHRD